MAPYTVKVRELQQERERGGWWKKGHREACGTGQGTRLPHFQSQRWIWLITLSSLRRHGRTLTFARHMDIPEDMLIVPLLYRNGEKKIHLHFC